MKTNIKRLVFAGAVFALASLCAFKVAGMKTANVSQTEGLYIFIESSPTGDYDNLGTVKQPGIAGSTSWDKAKQVMAKRTKKDYPEANAIIIKDANDLWKWEAIKLND